MARRKAAITMGAAVAGLAMLLTVLIGWSPGASALANTRDGSQGIAQADGNDPQVRIAVDLLDHHLNPRQLAFDTTRNGLWFWTSTVKSGRPENLVYFLDAATNQLRSWPIYGGDWSSQWLAGLAVAPNGDVWIGWNHNLVRFHPADGSYERFAVPPTIAYPLPTAAVKDILDDFGTVDLGISDIAADAGGTIWLARFAAQSITSFSPTGRRFAEHPLAKAAGDPAKLVVGPNGHIFFTTNRSPTRIGYIQDHIGEYDPTRGETTIYAHSAQALTITPNGDVYLASLAGVQGRGLVHLPASERASAKAQGRAPVFRRGIMPFGIDDRALARDPQGRIWMSVAGAPQVARFDPATGQAEQFQYAAVSAADFHAPRLSRGTPDPSQFVLAPLAAMVADDHGRLWYVREGSDKVEVVQG